MQLRSLGRPKLSRSQMRRYMRIVQSTKGRYTKKGRKKQANFWRNVRKGF